MCDMSNQHTLNKPYTIESNVDMIIVTRLNLIRGWAGWK